MIIASVEAVPYRIPYKIPAKWAGGFLEAAEHAVVIVTTDEGLTGIGEAIPRPTIYGETLPSIVYMVNNCLGPEIKGMNPLEIEKIWDRLKYIKWNYCAKGALDVALHDLLGKMLQIPLYKLFGGWADNVPLTHRVPSDSVNNMVLDCQKKMREGFGSFKIKIGNATKKDLELVSTIRETIGFDACLYADANGNYDVETALKIAPELERFALNYLEEPIPAWNKTGKLQLSRKTSIPILGDDSVITLADVFEEIQLGAIGAISVKIPRTGFYFSRKIVHLAEQVDIPVVIGTQAETALGAAASLQFAAAFKQVSIPSEITSHLNIEDQVINEELKINNGCLYVSDKPGLGVSINKDKLKYYSYDLKRHF